MSLAQESDRNVVFEITEDEPQNKSFPIGKHTVAALSWKCSVESFTLHLKTDTFFCEKFIVRFDSC